MSEGPPGLGAIARRLPDPILILRDDGRIIDANPACEALFASDPNALAGMRLTEFVVDAEASLRRYLGRCAMSPERTLGRIALRSPKAEYRCEGYMLEPAQPDRPACLLLRLLPSTETIPQFRFLNERIEALAKEVERRMQAEEILDSQRLVLEQIALGKPLEQILTTLTTVIDQQSSAGAHSSVLLLDVLGRLRHGAAPSLPAEYCAAIDGVQIGPNVGACGTAAFLNEIVTTVDVVTDPRWADYYQYAVDAGLRACYSTPITGARQEVLGTFALYYEDAREPDPQDQRLVGLLARTAAIAIERANAMRAIRELLERERASRNEAEEANRSKDEFLAMVSHELRNPLNAVLGWARVLLIEDADADTRAEGLSAIERNAAMQAQLIDEILDYARIKAGKMRLELEQSDLDELVRATVESARPSASARRIELDYIDAERANRASVDPVRVQQVVTNLLSNAIKFTAPGDTIRVSTGGDEQHAEIVVEDSGCGIEPRFLPFVFERFRQQDGSQRRRHEGLGLGLAIVRQVVELHGGEVFAHSDGPGCGARFTVRLPRGRTEGKSATRTNAATPELSGLRVLAVDDAADTRALLRTLFSSAGAEVAVAAGGEEALEKIAAKPPDVLLCDIGMPGMDGYEVIGRLRAQENGQRIAAIALTAYASSLDRERALAAGFDAHMAKPIDPGVLLRTVAETAGRPDS